VDPAALMAAMPAMAAVREAGGPQTLLKTQRMKAAKTEFIVLSKAVGNRLFAEFLRDPVLIRASVRSRVL
jgi:hypothetical protein